MREKNILSHPSSPLYKGVSRDYVRVDGFLLNTTKKVLQGENLQHFVAFGVTWYPDPGSNRDGLPHWCLRPARLPIPPSGLDISSYFIS